MATSPLLMPVAVVDLVYLDWCVFAADDGSDDVLLRAIHDVLFTSPFEYAEAVDKLPAGEGHNKMYAKWRNRFLDVLGLHTHIRNGGDVFVTSNANFVKATKQFALAELGAPLILDPMAADVYAEIHRA